MLSSSLISPLRCPIQLQRPEEVEGGGKTNNTLSLIEGQTEFTQTYVQSVETDIILDRKFTIPGYIYNLTLVSFNMHDVTAPNIIMRWRISLLSLSIKTSYRGGIYSAPTLLFQLTGSLTTTKAFTTETHSRFLNFSQPSNITPNVRR